MIQLLKYCLEINLNQLLGTAVKKTKKPFSLTRVLGFLQQISTALNKKVEKASSQIKKPTNLSKVLPNVDLGTLIRYSAAKP